MSERRLSDDDVKAIVDELEGRLTKRFYLNLGRGVWGLAWRGILVVVVLLAVYGAAQNGGIADTLKGLFR